MEGGLGSVGAQEEQEVGLVEYMVLSLTHGCKHAYGYREVETVLSLRSFFKNLNLIP